MFAERVGESRQQRDRRLSWPRPRAYGFGLFSQETTQGRRRARRQRTKSVTTFERDDDSRLNPDEPLRHVHVPARRDHHAAQRIPVRGVESSRNYDQVWGKGIQHRLDDDVKRR
jgi:hypothetical protein